VNNWIGKVYQLTNRDRKLPFMDGIDPEDRWGCAGHLRSASSAVAIAAGRRSYSAAAIPAPPRLEPGRLGLRHRRDEPGLSARIALSFSFWSSW